MAERTGQELLAEVREFISGHRLVVEREDGTLESRITSPAQRRLDFLDGCVLLTAEEAETVRRALNGSQSHICWTWQTEALALLGGQTPVTDANPHETKPQETRDDPASANPHGS